MRHFFGSVFVQEDEHMELEYYIQETRGSYGVEIKSAKPSHSGFASYGNITSDYGEITGFVQCLMENSAYPENLSEYVEDYLYEKELNGLMGGVIAGV